MAMTATTTTNTTKPSVLCGDPSSVTALALTVMLAVVVGDS
jgi:hypothetical protein